MSEPEVQPLQIELTQRIPLVPWGDDLALDPAWQARQQKRDDDEWQALLAESAARESMAPMGKATPDKPSAVAKGAETALEHAGQGSESFMRGLTSFLLSGAPATEDAGRGLAAEVTSGLAGKAVALKDMAMGFMGVLSSPGAGVGAGLEQALKNIAPEHAALAPFGGGPGGTGSLFRAMAGGDPSDLSPMTLGEIAKIIGERATPVAASKAKGAGKQFKKAMGEERGSISVEPGSPIRPGTEGEPTLAPPGEVRVNLARIDAAQSVKTTISNINALNAERLTGNRAVKGHAATIAESQGALSLDEALALPEGHPLTEGQVTALRDLRDAAATHVDQLVKRVLTGEENTGLLEAFLVAAELEAKRETSVRTAARVIEAQKIPSLAERSAFDLERLSELGAMLRGVEGIDEATLAARLAALRTDGGRHGYAGKVGRFTWAGYKTVLDVLHWAFIQSLLSGPVTHAANVLGTGALMAYHLPERFLAGAINDVFFRNPNGVHLGEAWAAARGMAEGAYTDSLRMMGRALKGETAFGQGPVEAHFDLRAKTFGLDPDNLPGKAIEIAGMLQPTRLMGVEDAAFKGMNYRAELKALSVREATAEGLRGKAHGQRAADLEANPTPSMLAEARDAALLRTLNASLGPAGQHLMAAMSLTPGARFIAPFVRTPTNIGKAVWQRAPVLNLLSAQNWKDISGARKNPAARDMALSRMALGSAVGGAIVWQVTQGNITGAGPNNKNVARDQREDGLPQYAIRVGDEWFGYSRLDPVGMFIGTMATAVETLSQVPDPGEHWEAIAYAAMTGAGKSMLSKTWASGVRDTLDAIEKPDRSAKKVAMGWARAIVPAGIRQLARAGLPGIVEPHPELREVRDYTDAILSGLPDLTPGAAKVGIDYDLPSVLDVPPQLHPITGEPMTYPAGWGPDLMSPIYVTRRKDDPVLDEIVGHEISIAPMARVIEGQLPPEVRTTAEKGREGIKLSKDEYLRVQILATKGGESPEAGGVTLGALAGKPTLYDRLLLLINSSPYQQLGDGPEGGRADEIRRVVNTYREAARLQLRREVPALDDAIRDRIELRQRMKLGPAKQPGPLPSTGPASAEFLSRMGGRLLDTIGR